MSDKVYQVITDRILKALEEGVVPWQKPWKNSDKPKNIVKKVAYRGINAFLLRAACMPSPWWLTYNQAKKLGGHVKANEKGTPIVFWKPCESKHADVGISLKEVEKILIRNTLAQVGSNRQEAAKILGIGERTLYRKLKTYGLS